MGLPADGYSSVYQFSILIASFFYLFWGIHYLKKLLKKYTENHFILFITILLIVFATPLFHYAAKMPSFTHAYSFSLISFFLYNVKRFSETHLKKNLLPLAAAIALIILLRPTNGLVILSIPVICENWNNTKQFFIALFKNTKPLIAAFILFLSFLSIIPILYKLQVNEWFIWQYRDRANYEANVGFNFANPNLFNFLFSYRNGLFIYSPILFLALGGFIPMFKKKKFQATWLLIALIATTYILSSWHSWYYGMSFGMRAIVEYLPYFAILMVTLLSVSFKYKNTILIFSTTLFIAFTMVQNYQYRHSIFHWNMSKEKYWEVFIQTKKKYKWYLDRKYRSYEVTDSLLKVVKSKKVFSKLERSFENYGKTNNEISCSGYKSMIPNHWNTFLFNDSLKNYSYHDTLLTLAEEIQCYPFTNDLIKNR